jgi:hypothetical protein
MKIAKMILVCVTALYSFPLFASPLQPHPCNKGDLFALVKPEIMKLDHDFQWNNSSCQIIATKSAFPKAQNNGIKKFEDGLQLFVYQNYSLKYICLPGWTCKAW